MTRLLRHASLTLAAIGLCTACAMAPQGTRVYHHNGLPQAEMDCLAFASQAAQGAGGWTSVAPVRAAIYDHARQQYYQQCMQSK